jgi:hypothetical protein
MRLLASYGTAWVFTYHTAGKYWQAVRGGSHFTKARFRRLEQG